MVPHIEYGSDTSLNRALFRYPKKIGSGSSKNVFGSDTQKVCFWYLKTFGSGTQKRLVLASKIIWSWYLIK